MGQRRIFAAVAILAAMAFVVFAVRRHPTPATSDGAVEPRVASVTPAGTDIIVGIGAADHLVGVSSFDDNREGVSGKPRIGDYQGIDWEKLAPLHAGILITQYGQSRFPPQLQQRCNDLNIQIVNIKIDLIEDIYRESKKVAQAIHEKDKGDRAVAALNAKLEQVRNQVAGKRPVRAIVVTSDSGLGLAGPGEFLDELLTIAGGQNTAAGAGMPYLSVNREKLIDMTPDAIIQLIPDGDKTPQVMAQARHFWEMLPDLPAVKNHRILIITDWYALQPSLRVGELAQQFADFLHPETRR